MRNAAKQTIAILILGTIAQIARAEVVVEIFCLGAIGSKQAKLEFRTYHDIKRGFTFAAIKYEKSNKTIPLILRDTQVSKLSANTPHDLTRVWLEIVDEKFTGEYTMASQGATINSFVYRASGKGKAEFEFEPLPSIDIDPQRGCKW